MSGRWPKVCVALDGCLNSYTSGWTGDEVDLPDPPVVGAREAVETLLARGYDVIILTTRARSVRGLEAVWKWLKHWNFPELEVTATKPAASVYIDDRAMRFEGDFTPVLAALPGKTAPASWVPAPKETKL